ncbi:MAG TPA: hypothetical protein VGL22_02750 [Terracidiphilus sp.]|jgi:hypothetical protein
MRRLVSIAMVLLFWLGPLSALLPGSDESQLPACCRRHGVHRCVMSIDEASGPVHVVSAPASCPRYHRPAPATRCGFTLPGGFSIAHATAAEPIVPSVQIVTAHQARPAADRGPPALL